MRGQKLVLVKGVYSLEKWTKPNPVMSTENRPVDISSVVLTMMQGGSQLKIIGGPALLRDWPPGGTL